MTADRMGGACSHESSGSKHDAESASRSVMRVARIALRQKA
jgi:hypothetical protein